MEKWKVPSASDTAKTTVKVSMKDANPQKKQGHKALRKIKKNLLRLYQRGIA